jgi:uncharacterized integral membrane protein (TIGR00697 family)
MMEVVLNDRRVKLYVYLISVLCVIFVASNLICKKFVSINIFNHIYFEISVGVLFFPLTFLITDVITEFYGKYYARLAVMLCLATGSIIIAQVLIASYLNATTWSTVSDNNFLNVFNVYDISILASFVTFYISQLFDIHIFSSIKKFTRDQHLWLRNNVSSFISQLIDTLLIVGVLTIFQVIPYEKYFAVVYSSYLFKLMAAILDTPFCYLAHYSVKRYLENNRKLKTTEV